MRFENINYIYFDGRKQVKFVFIFTTRYLPADLENLSFFSFLFRIRSALNKTIQHIKRIKHFAPGTLLKGLLSELSSTFKFTFGLGSAYYYCGCPTSVFPPLLHRLPLVDRENVGRAVSFRCIQNRKSIFDKFLSWNSDLRRRFLWYFEPIDIVYRTIFTVLRILVGE